MEIPQDQNQRASEETSSDLSEAKVEVAAKKIKVVVSDLHLGKGMMSANGELNALEEFYYSEKLVEFIHFYSTGQYRDYQVELIINGDFLNFLQCDYHAHFLTVITESVSLSILKEIMEGHKMVFVAMAEFAAKPGNQITYVVGNHDQPMMWPSCRAYFNEILKTNVRFKNMVYFFDGVHIEHGHMHEAANRMDPKKFFLKKDLPEPILNLPFGSHFFIEVVLKIKERYPHVDKIRPFKKMVRWSFFNEPGVLLHAFWTACKYFFRTALKANPRNSVSLRKLLSIIFESAIFPDLSDSAKKILSDERVHTVVFGHTHVYQYKQIGASKEYFNTGTWTELTSLDIASLGKITKLTYVLFEYPNQGSRPRGRLKEWKGYHKVEENVSIS